MNSAGPRPHRAADPDDALQSGPGRSRTPRRSSCRSRRASRARGQRTWPTRATLQSVMGVCLARARGQRYWLYQSSKTPTHHSQPRAGYYGQKRESNQTSAWMGHARHNIADRSHSTTIGIRRMYSLNCWRFSDRPHSWRSVGGHRSTARAQLVLRVINAYGNPISNRACRKTPCPAACVARPR